MWSNSRKNKSNFLWLISKNINSEKRKCFIKVILDVEKPYEHGSSINTSINSFGNRSNRRNRIKQHNSHKDLVSNQMANYRKSIR